LHEIFRMLVSLLDFINFNKILFDVFLKNTAYAVGCN
jgi:hypothetical protein